MNLAILYMQQERWSEALAYTDTFMTVVSQSPEVRRQRAWILEQNGGS